MLRGAKLFINLTRFFHTVKYLKPVQIYGRIWHYFYQPRIPSLTTPSIKLPDNTFTPPIKKKERRLKIKKILSLLGLYSFDEAAAGKYAVIRAQLEREGMVISERDTQIASIAMANKLTVVTHNVKEFGRISRLKVEDWATE